MRSPSTYFTYLPNHGTADPPRHLDLRYTNHTHGRRFPAWSLSNASSGYFGLLSHMMRQLQTVPRVILFIQKAIW